MLAAFCGISLLTMGALGVQAKNLVYCVEGSVQPLTHHSVRILTNWLNWGGIIHPHRQARCLRFQVRTGFPFPVIIKSI
ncbi:MAG: hypothetical protein DSY80_06570 [Desulfocapsa sp.]|nr:MAG: hypothetical protein DSY80_06570 [Desulfocapsa sp.]